MRVQHKIPPQQVTCKNCGTEGAIWFATMHPSGRPVYFCNNCKNEFEGEGEG